MDNKSLFTGIPGVFIPVKNLEKSAQWYESVLGLKEFQRSDFTVEFKINNGGPVLILFQAESNVPVKFPSVKYIDGYYFIFKVLDAEVARNKLIKEGVKVSEMHLFQSVHQYSFFQDIDGNKLAAED